MTFSLSLAVDDLQRLGWTLRRKPLESFLAPQAAVPLEGGGGALVCRDGSLVSLIAVDGSRSMMGGEELERFVALASRRLNTVPLRSRARAPRRLRARTPTRPEASLTRTPRPRAVRPRAWGSISTTCWPSVPGGSRP